MKKRTLNQTWVLCLRMWRWIVKQIREGSKLTVYELKSQWLSDNGFEHVSGECFFCDVAATCSYCPGRLIDPDFSCDADAYDYRKNPAGFLKELLRLNRIRKGKYPKSPISATEGSKP